MDSSLYDFGNQHGVCLPSKIICDGRIRRFNPQNGKDRGSDSGWYIGHATADRQWVVVGDWAAGAGANGKIGVWVSGGGRVDKTLSAEIEKKIREAQKQEQKLYAEAREKSAKLWDQALPADAQNPYCARKKIEPYAARQLDINGEPTLLIPVFDRDYTLVGLQKINETDGKKFIYGTRLGGSFCLLGSPQKTLLIAEGWATGCSLHEATGHAVYVAFNCGNLTETARIARDRHPDAEIIVAADQDAWEKDSDNLRTPERNAGQLKAKEAALVCGGVVKTIPVTAEKMPDGRHPTDFNDWCFLHGRDAVRAIIDAPEALKPDTNLPAMVEGKRHAPQSSWQKGFILTKEGEIKRTSTANAMLVFENDARVKDRFRFNRLTKQILCDGHPIEDHEEVHALVWLEREWGISVHERTMHSIIQARAMENAFDPVKNYLSSLKWDGIPRLEMMLVDLLGAEDTLYTRAVGKRFMISAVARALNPGCKVDAMLVLEGEQGTKRKSTFIRKLFGDEFFSDAMPDINSKDASMIMCTKWCFEIAELDALEKKEVSAIKLWITRQVEHYRPAYGRNVVEEPRPCVFIGTTNEDEYLKDQTGGRRFLPIKCTEFNHADMPRDQLWAEAVVLYKSGELCFLTGEELEAAKQQQQERLIGDPWETSISEYAQNRREVRIPEVLGADCLCVPKERWTRGLEIRVGGVLRKLGFRRLRRADAQNCRYYVYINEKYEPPPELDFRY